jgi:hypothetical protein
VVDMYNGLIVVATAAGVPGEVVDAGRAGGIRRRIERPSGRPGKSR